MKVILENTTKVVYLNGVPARIWEGETETGIKVHAYVTRIAIDVDEPRFQEFTKELEECKAPSKEIEAIPIRLIL